MLIFTMIVLSISLFAVTYVFLVMPRATDGADMDLQSSDYADGGIHGKEHKRGSIEAIREARDLGFGVALDVGVSKDRKIFVLPSINADLTLSDGASISSGIHKLPTLSEILSLLDGQVPLLIRIEVEDERERHTLCKQLCIELDSYSGALAIRSSDVRVLTFFKKYRPRYARGVIISKNDKRGSSLVRFLRRHMFTNLLTRPDFITIDGRMMREPAFLLATKVFRRRGFAFTVKSQKQYELCKRRGIYAIFENVIPQ
jgi:glycerophosphoryl diester phosphodiesterase